MDVDLDLISLKINNNQLINHHLSFCFRASRQKREDFASFDQVQTESNYTMFVYF